MLFERTPYIDIGRNRKKFLFDSCLDIVEHICQNDVLAKSLSVVRRLFVQCSLAGPFNGTMKVLWPESMDELKSTTTIFSHNLLNLFALQQII
jgi:hypothetical protein